jgi:hypothetical protein
MSDATRDFARRLLAATRLFNGGAGLLFPEGLAAGIAAFSGRLPRGVGLTITLISALNTALALYAGTADRRGR